MKDWLVCAFGDRCFCLTRVEIESNGHREYLCGLCDAPLTDSVFAYFESSKGSRGTVSCSICGQCDLLLGAHDLPAGELDSTIELLLAEEQS